MNKYINLIYFNMELEELKRKIYALLMLFSTNDIKIKSYATQILDAISFHLKPILEENKNLNNEIKKLKEEIIHLNYIKECDHIWYTSDSNNVSGPLIKTCTKCNTQRI
jgi:hypothetical protein